MKNIDGLGCRKTLRPPSLLSHINSSFAIVLLDEVDGFLGQRHKAAVGMKTELITDDALVLVLAATYRPQVLDETILRRLPQAFEVGIPDRIETVKILKVILKGERTEKKISYDYIASTCEGFTGSGLLERCKQAAYFPLRELLQK
ncbi:hypothetical protein Taro_018942 [Colocasia esculenta]|uniref:ATPase AAA-type core domain-containing protein n=1 Tax=Colocasia esculenta TaxID=4460 RepID=A0A843V0L5_COLES|nr:hypothetical protein [Colocasia esculenta]